MSAVFDGVLFAFQAELAGGFGGGFGAGGHQVVEGQDFGADKASGEVGMDAPGGGQSVCAIRKQSQARTSSSPTVKKDMTPRAA